MRNFRILYLFLGLTILISCVKEKSLPSDIFSDTKLLINEVMTFDSPNWIEIYNPGDTDVYMEGFHLINRGKVFTIVAGFVPAKGFALFFCDEGNFANHTNFLLSSSVGSISITDAANKIIDKITYPQMSKALSYGRKPDGSTNFQFFDIPTPNSTNIPVYIPNQAPVINEVSLTPEFPVAYQVVTVDAHVTDDYRIDTLFLFYEYDGFDTIVHFSPSCCDPRKAAAEIKGLAAGTIVNYFVKAVDDSSLVTFYPSGAPLIKMTYTVNQ